MIVELTPYSLRAAGSSGSELISLLAELQLPLAIIDHIQHQLVPCSVAELLRWCENVDACPEDQGFMNIFLGQLEKTAARTAQVWFFTAIAAIISGFESRPSHE